MSIIYLHCPQIDSTQDWARREAAQLDEKSWLVLSADAQTKGRGQQNKSWHSPACGNIYTTIAALWPVAFLDKLTYITQVTSLTIAQALEKHGAVVKLKWINDLFLNGKKIGGVLCESWPIEHSEKRAVALGIGLNLNMAPTESSHIDQPSSSLYAETKIRLDASSFLHVLVEQLFKNLNLLHVEGFAHFAIAIQKRLLFIQQLIVLCHPHGKTEGIFLGIDLNGRARIAVAGKGEKKFSSGHLRLKNSI